MFYVSSEKSLLQYDWMLRCLRQTYWAGDRTMEQLELAAQNSICFGAYLTQGGQQIGLVRVVTDFVCAFYLCDVVVDPAYRGRGVGKTMLATVMEDSRFCRLRGLLVTSDAHRLYAQFGFVPANDRHMGREPRK